MIKKFHSHLLFSLSFESWYEQRHHFLFSPLSILVQQQKKITSFARPVLTFTACFRTGPIKIDQHNSSSSHQKKTVENEYSSSSPKNL